MKEEEEMVEEVTAAGVKTGAEVAAVVEKAVEEDLAVVEED